MIFIGLLALLVVGVSVTLTSVVGLARRLTGRRPHIGTAGGTSPAAKDVAVLIAAHNAADRLVGTLNSVTQAVPLANVFLVSDDSTDGTLELAREYGATVAETFGRQGRAGAIEAGVQAFRLVDNFAFVVLVDVDTRLDPRHVERVLPLFDDPAVVAVDVRVDYDRHPGGRTPVGRLLASYRARAYAVAQWLRTVRRSGTPASTTRALPSVARTYRTAALTKINTPEPVIEDFDATLRIYRAGLGRIGFCPEVAAGPAQAGRLADYRRQTDQWFTGYWLAVLRTGASAGVLLAAIELVLTSVVLALTPAALVLGGLAAARLAPAWATSLLGIGAAVLLADYVLTVAVAAAKRQPRYLVAGLTFPLLRVLDAVSALRALARVWLGEPRSEWLSFRGKNVDTAPRSVRARPAPAVRETRRRSGWLAGLGWLLVIGSAAVAVIRVAVTRNTLGPSSGELATVDFAYSQSVGQAEPVVDAGLVVAGLQLRTYTSVTSAFDRGMSVLAAARELSVVTSAAVILGLVLVAAMLRVRPLVIAFVLGLLAMCTPVIILLTPVGPGGIAAACLTVPAAALVAAAGSRDFRWVTAGAIALLVAVSTAVILIIPLGVGLAAAVAGRRMPFWPRVAGGLGSLAITAGVAVLLWRAGLLLLEPPGAGVLDHDQRLVLLGAVTAVALAGLVTGWLRSVAIGTAAGVGFAVALGPGADALLPALVLCAAILVAAMIEDAAGWRPAGTPVVAARAAAGLAAAVVVACSIAGVTRRPTPWHPPDHASLARWVAGNLDSGVRLVAPDTVWLDLHRELSRAGLPDGNLRKATPGAAVNPGELQVMVGPDRPAGIELAEFGSTPDGSPAMAVLLANPAAEYVMPEGRARAGARLADNPRLRTTDEVREAVRTGRVDLRAMALLAGLCGAHEVTLAATGNPTHERDSPMPHRILTLSEVDGRSVADPPSAAALLAWLRAQQAPYAPADIAVTPDGVTLRWRLPARLDNSA